MGRKQRNSNGKFRNGAPNNQYGYSGNNYPNNQFGDFGTDFSNGRIYDKQYGEVKKSNKGSILIGFLIGLLVMGGIGAGVLFFLNIGSNKNVTPVIKHTPTATPTPEPTVTPTPEPTATPTPEPTVIQHRNPIINIPDNIKVGDYVNFGAYSQESSTGEEPIEWEVWDIQNGTALLVSRKGLYAREFNSKAEVPIPTNWEKCSLREWLNTEFYEEAFLPEEQELIVETNIHTEDNKEYGISGGNDTVDKVFILSREDLEDHYGFDSYDYTISIDDLRLPATKYAEMKGAGVVDERAVELNPDLFSEKGIGYCTYWWLRSPGAFDATIMTVSAQGEFKYPKGVDTFLSNICVRPALWINLAS